jgi:DNA-binding CsgD family transcriptional regulator
MRSRIRPSSAPDLVAVLDLVDRVSAAPDLTSYARRTCEGILALVPALSVSYNELNPGAGRAHAVIVPDPGPGWFRTFRRVFQAHQSENPLVERFLATGDTRVLAWGDPGVGTALGTTLDKVFYEPNGIRSQAAVMLPAPPGVLIGIAVNRGEEGFSLAERRLLSLLRPHLVHAYRAVQLRADTDLLGSVLGESGWAVVLVDSDGRVVRSTPGVAAVAARYGLDADDGALLAAGPLEAVRAIIRAYDPATPAAPSRTIPATGPDGTLEAMVVPSIVGPHVVLLRRRGGLAALAAAGLTPRQAEVALALGAGRTNTEISRQLGITPATVKKHLEGIYATLGVGHRAAAAARVAALR